MEVKKVKSYKGFEAVIGLEVHAQLSTKSKLFSTASNGNTTAPNHHINMVCTAQPGSLPILNKEAIFYAIKAGLATNCLVQKKSVFARKNYFYPDLPKGYQISQFDLPLATSGYLDINMDTEDFKKFTTKRIGITRIHMEEDAGKSTHMADYSLIDLNRAGTPLIEIVSEPDFRDPKEAVEYLKKLRTILQYIDVCDGNMQEGNFRCDANISIRKLGESKLGIRTEIKNINSFRFVEKALEVEILRQLNVVLSGGIIVQETRLYDSTKNVTSAMRQKEDAHDYRYFPEPDLPPLYLEETWIQKLKDSLPELPDAKKSRWIRELSISEYDASVLSSSKALADFYEEVLQHSGGEAKLSANWVMGDFLAFLKEEAKEIKDSPIRAKHLGELIVLIVSKEISSKIAKTVFLEMCKTGADPRSIVEKKGLRQLDDPKLIKEIVDMVIMRNPQQVKQYLSGKEKLFGFFVGQAMKESKGKANPEILNQSLKATLNNMKDKKG